MHENVAEKISIFVEVQGGTSGTHAAVGKLNSALATCPLKNFPKNLLNLPEARSKYEVRER